MLIKFLVLYFLVGLVYACIHCCTREEDRIHVILAILTGWPVFLFSMIGAGWHALLNQGRRE